MTTSRRYFIPLTLTLLSAAPLTVCGGAQERTKHWTFAELLKPPTADELQRVDREWARKEWRIADTRLVGATTVPVGAERFDARLYQYTVNGSRRCGAVIVPHGASPGSLAGLVDIGDIRWDYPDRNLTNGPYVAKILGAYRREVALVVPCARGMALRIGDLRVQAEGDRRDAWEGVAEDAIAFLTVALSVAPEIDSRRLATYGYSRGGGVALIMGQRDPRIDAVLAFAGPTDWFSAMGRPGINWAQRLEEAYADRKLEPDSRESQFLDWFVRDRDTLPLSEMRRRLIGSSPLYFAEKLPAFQVHHGAEDRPVPVLNATALRDRLATQTDTSRIFIYEGAGHLLDNTPALTVAREFLARQLFSRRI